MSKPIAVLLSSAALAALAATGASAMPIAPSTAPALNVEQVRRVCNEWGRCWYQRTITVRTGTIEAMTTTSGESVTDTDIAMAITVHVGAAMAVGVAVGRITMRKGMTTSKVTTNNEPPAST